LPGGLIVADSILRRGLTADSSSANSWAAEEKQAEGGGGWISDDSIALDGSNKAMINEPRIGIFLMPMFDGLGMEILVD